jgi:hypothetical protein
MGWVRVMSASVVDEEISISADVPNIHGACFGLRGSELEQARIDTNFNRPVKNVAQKRMFAGYLPGKYVNIKSLGGVDEKGIEELTRKEKGKGGLMGKDETAKWEWTFRVRDRKAVNLVELDPKLEALLDDIEKLENVGSGGFKGWGKLKWGESDKDDELTVMARFRKGLSQGDHFNNEVIAPIIKMVMSLLPKDTEYLGREIKE